MISSIRIVSGIPRARFAQNKAVVASSGPVGPVGSASAFASLSPADEDEAFRLFAALMNMAGSTLSNMPENIRRTFQEALEKHPGLRPIIQAFIKLRESPEWGALYEEKRRISLQSGRGQSLATRDALPGPEEHPV